MVALSQRSNIEKILMKFFMNNCKPITIFFATRFKLPHAECLVTKRNTKYIKCVPYSNKNGSLMFVMVCTSLI